MDRSVDEECAGGGFDAHLVGSNLLDGSGHNLHKVGVLIEVGILLVGHHADELVIGSGDLESGHAVVEREFIVEFQLFALKHTFDYIDIADEPVEDSGRASYSGFSAEVNFAIGTLLHLNGCLETITEGVLVSTIGRRKRGETELIAHEVEHLEFRILRYVDVAELVSHHPKLVEFGQATEIYALKHIVGEVEAPEVGVVESDFAEVVSREVDHLQLLAVAQVDGRELVAVEREGGEFGIFVEVQLS